MRTWLSRLGRTACSAARAKSACRTRSSITSTLLVEDLKRGGMSDADARLAARKQFGGVDQLRMTSS